MATSQTKETSVYGLDIGVYRTGQSKQVLASTTAAWARLSKGIGSFEGLEYEGSPTEGSFHRSGENTRTSSSIDCGRSILKLSAAIAKDIDEENRVALGFEAPMWFPVVHEHRASLDVFRPRFEEESDHRWYLQSGAAATLKATSLGILLLKELQRRISVRFELTTTDENWKPGTLLLYESFVAGPYKVDGYEAGSAASDEWDALTSALAWGNRHADFAIPKGYEASSIHASGSSDGPVLSVWDHIAPERGVEGPKDCEVVALKTEG